MGGPGSGRKKGSSGKKYKDPRVEAQKKASRSVDRKLKKAGINPKENPADRRKRLGY